MNQKDSATRMVRLSFRVPETVRLAWTSDAVRVLREPIIRKVKRAWAEMEWRSVNADVRRCALCVISQEDAGRLVEDAGKAGLKVEPMRVEERSGAPGSAKLLMHAAVGRKNDCRDFKEAWIRGDDERIGELLGFPQCCRRFFQRAFVEEKQTDPVWAIARSSARARQEGKVVVLTGEPLLNVMLRSIGVRAVPHFPCSMDCEESVKFAERFMEVGRSLGYGDEVEWLQEMLCWPVEWSGLHGLAEIRTPIVKICTQTDATAEKLTIRWIGEGYPPDGARGGAFPFKQIRL